jgi:hypothetical protein
MHKLQVQPHTPETPPKTGTTSTTRDGRRLRTTKWATIYETADRPGPSLEAAGQTGCVKIEGVLETDPVISHSLNRSYLASQQLKLNSLRRRGTPPGYRTTI